MICEPPAGLELAGGRLAGTGRVSKVESQPGQAYTGATA